MYNVMSALCGCRAVKFDSCNNILSSVHTILVIILRSVSLSIKRKYYIIHDQQLQVLVYTTPCLVVWPKLCYDKTRSV